MKRFCCFIPQHRFTLTKQRFDKIFTEAWDKAAMPSNNKAHFRTTGIYPFKTLIIPAKHLLPVFNTECGHPRLFVLEYETPAAALLSQKTWKASAVPGMSGKVAPTNRNNDMFSSDKEYNVDTGRNAFIAAVQRTPEHSRFLTLNSYQSILSILR